MEKDSKKVGRQVVKYIIYIVAYSITVNSLTEMLADHASKKFKLNE